MKATLNYIVPRERHRNQVMKARIVCLEFRHRTTIKDGYNVESSLKDLGLQFDLASPFITKVAYKTRHFWKQQNDDVNKIRARWSSWKCFHLSPFAA